MDLKAMLNDGAAAQTPVPKPPPHPRPASQQQQHQHPQALPSHQHQQHPLPSTPIQSGPHPFEYPQSVQQSPARAMSRDYHPSQQPLFSSPPPPHHGAGTPYAGPGRAPPPPLRQLSGPHGMRSPSAGSMPQSPYAARTPATSMRPESAGYPFPGPSHPHPDLASPIQQPNRYPPSGSYPSRDPRDRDPRDRDPRDRDPRDRDPRDRDPRESHSQPSGAMASPSATGHPPAGYYHSAPSAIPPTPPPLGMPGGGQQQHISQQHARSGSTQSYHAYPQQFASPVNSNHQMLPSEHMRPPSQPPTPHGPPLSTASRQSGGAGTFAQPPSPYQQRAPPSAPPYPYPSQQSQQPQQHRQPSQPPQQPSPQVAPRPQPSPRTQPSPRPQPSPQAPMQRPPSAYDQPPVHPQAVDPHRPSFSHSDRERSLSVSPKTRVPSLPSSVGHHSQTSLSGPSGPPAELDPRQTLPNTATMREGPVKLEREAPPLTAPRAERASTPAKRKMDDRDITEEDLEQQEPRPPPFANGSHRPGSSSRPTAPHHPEAPMPARRKPRHAQSPIWAVPYDRQPLKNGNFYLRKPHINQPQVNGKTKPTISAPRAERPSSRHASPEASRANAPGPVAAQPSPVPAIPTKPTMLGPWEPTIANIAPLDDVVNSVADFLYLNVVQPSELTKLHGQKGIHFEIEAKLGCLAVPGAPPGNRFRFQPPLLSETVLDPHADFTPSFVSDMDESKHRFFNDHLNALVKQSSPQNPSNKNSSEPRVPINYVHTKEIDRFLDLKDYRAALPPILLKIIEESRGRIPSIRVTRDKNNRIIAKIIKVKISDLHIHMPKALLDCRITVNVEVDYHGVLEGLDDGVGQPDRTDRQKDRLSYRQGVYQVDLTQVSQPEAGPGQGHKKHELEIELNTDAVIEHGRRAAQDVPNNFDFLVEGFVNNIRYLARKISAMGPQ